MPSQPQCETDRQQPVADGGVGGFRCSHMKPHFLFNALSQIAAATGAAPDTARELVLCLADLLRAGIGYEESALHSMDGELDLLNSYAAIERERFRGRFSIDVAAASGLPALLPAFTLVGLAGHLLRETLLPCGGGALTVYAALSGGRVLCRASAEPLGEGPRLPNGPEDGAPLPGIDGRLRRAFGIGLETVHRNGLLVEVRFTVPETTERAQP